jgi:preprotein translocase subunit SecG
MFNFWVVFFWSALALVLVFLILKRVKDKKKENFEKRDN